MKINKCQIKKDDKVKIIAGKDKDKFGKVIQILKKKNRVLVENVNMVKRHSRPNAANAQGGIIEKEAPIHLSNVMLMCPKCVAAVRPKAHLLEDGRKIRACRKCNEPIDS